MISHPMKSGLVCQQGKLGKGREMTQSGSFGKNSIITLAASILNIALGIFVSIIIARLLGSEGKGIYTVTTLFSYLIVTLGSLGLPSAATFRVARRSYAHRQILENSVLLGLLTGTLGIIAGLITVILMGQYVFPGVSQTYLLFALLIIPGNILFVHLQYVLLGIQHIKGYNLTAVIQSVLLVVLIMIFVGVSKMDITGALMAVALSWIFANPLAFSLAVKINNVIKLQVNFSYIKNALGYGLKIYISHILRLLSLRINLFLVNSFLNPDLVGFYSISVGLIEKLWLIFQTTATVLFPKIAMEMDEGRKKEFTPVVARTVLWITILVTLAVFFLGQWLIEFLYSQTFILAVTPLKILLVGTVPGSLYQILGNDIAGRGRPILNVYANIVGFISAVILSVLWIPNMESKGQPGRLWSLIFSAQLLQFFSMPESLAIP